MYVTILVVSGVERSYLFFFFKQKTAYEMRISDWSSDVCSSDLADFGEHGVAQGCHAADGRGDVFVGHLRASGNDLVKRGDGRFGVAARLRVHHGSLRGFSGDAARRRRGWANANCACGSLADSIPIFSRLRPEEHTSELQSLIRIPYAVFCFNI